MFDKGVLAVSSQGQGLATFDLGQTSRVVLDNPTTSAKSNYARAFAQDWHRDPHPNDHQDLPTNVPPTNMHAPDSGEDATTSDVEMPSDVTNTQEGDRTIPKRSTMPRTSLGAIKDSRHCATGGLCPSSTGTKDHHRWAYDRSHSAMPSPASEHLLARVRTAQTLGDDVHATQQPYDEQQSPVLAGLYLSNADVSAFTSLSASIATTILSGILAATLLSSKTETSHGVVLGTDSNKLLSSSRVQSAQAEQRFLVWPTRLCQGTSSAVENLGTRAVF